MQELLLFYKKVFNHPLQNIPSLFFLGTALFGILTLLSLLISDFLVVPFVLVATVALFVAMWYIKILGTLSENLEKMEENVEQLKDSNDKLHEELQAMENLRKNLESYAQENNTSLKKVVSEINQSFQKLEAITKENEKVLLYKIAQDLEFMDKKIGMSQEEYQRFIKRVPSYLKAKFKPFDEIANSDKKIDYKELSGVIQSILDQQKIV